MARPFYLFVYLYMEQLLYHLCGLSRGEGVAASAVSIV